jgi:hypothetical protein
MKITMLLAFTLAASTTASAKDMFSNRADKDPT